LPSTSPGFARKPLDSQHGSGLSFDPEALMTEYQAVIVRLQGKSREDEDVITDLLNERARGGWTYHSLDLLPDQKVLAVFTRQA